jgi:hypothetical protein
MYIYRAKTGPLSSVDFDSAYAAVVIHDPIEFGDFHTPFTGWRTQILSNVNGSGSPSFLRICSTPGRAELVLYSLGNAADTKFDAWFRYEDNAAAQFPQCITDIGDIDGDGISDFAVASYPADSGSIRQAGEVYIIRGSGDIPHKPVRNSVAERRASAPIAMRVWPAPASERATIQFQLASGEDAARVTIVDAVGRVIAEYRDFARGGGWYTLPLDVRPFAAGTYRCVVTVGTKIQQAVVQVMH